MTELLNIIFSKENIRTAIVLLAIIGGLYFHQDQRLNRIEQDIIEIKKDIKIMDTRLSIVDGNIGLLIGKVEYIKNKENN